MTFRQFLSICYASGVDRNEVRRRVALNLARLREDRGLTQAALAARLGWSRARVGKIERGLVDLPVDDLHGLAGALDTTWGDLYDRERLLRSVRFRARTRVHGRAQVLAEVSRWLDTYRRLETDLDDTVPFAFEPARGHTDPAEAARAARRAIGLREREPIANICGLLESGGVKVLLLDKKRDSFFGLSVGEPDGGPAVVVNTWDRIAVERWIFTAAHELGHLVLHPGEYDPDASDLPEDAEREADDFAGEFVMPEAAFARGWEATIGAPLSERVLRTKRIFRVGYRSVLWRLVAGCYEDTDVWLRFHADYTARYGKALLRDDEPESLEGSEFSWDWKRSAEPVPLSEHDCRDARFAHLIRQAADKGLVSIRFVAAALDLHYEDALHWVRRSSP